MFPAESSMTVSLPVEGKDRYSSLAGKIRTNVYMSAISLSFSRIQYGNLTKPCYRLSFRIIETKHNNKLSGLRSP